MTQDPGTTGGGRPGFLGHPIETVRGAIKADFVFMGLAFGIPYDMRGVYPPSAEAPHAVRRVSRRYEGESLHYDFDLGGPLFPDENWTIADAGDAAGDPASIEATAANATAAVAEVVATGAVPLVIGGDHSIPPLIVAALADQGPIDVIHVDAHLDFRDDVDGIRGGYSSPIRRLSEMPWIRHIVQVGLRGVGSARTAEVEAARANGNMLITADEVHARGVDWIIAGLEKDVAHYVTVDMDGLDPAWAPGVLWPAPGGLTFSQVAALLRGVAGRGRLVGADFCEYVPTLDVNDLTALAVFRLLMNLMGASARRGRTPA